MWQLLYFIADASSYLSNTQENALYRGIIGALTAGFFTLIAIIIDYIKNKKSSHENKLPKIKKSKDKIPEIQIEKICPNCNQKYPANRKYCPECDIKLVNAPTDKYCPKCGKKYEPTRKSCPDCDIKLKSRRIDKSILNIIVYGVLSLLFLIVFIVLRLNTNIVFIVLLLLTSLLFAFFCVKEIFTKYAENKRNRGENCKLADIYNKIPKAVKIIIAIVLVIVVVLACTDFSFYNSVNLSLKGKIYTCNSEHIDCFANFEYNSDENYYYTSKLYTANGIVYTNEIIAVDMQDFYKGEANYYFHNKYNYNSNVVYFYEKVDTDSEVVLTERQNGTYCFTDSSECYHKNSCFYVKDSNDLHFADSTIECELYNKRPCSNCIK